MINKFLEPQQTEMILKAHEILKKHDKDEWKRSKKVLEFLLSIRNKIKLKIEEKELLTSLLNTVYDENLDVLSYKAIHEMLINSQDPSESNEIILNHIKQKLEGWNKEEKYSKLNTIAKILLQNNLGDTQLMKDVVERLAEFFKDHDGNIVLSAVGNVIEFMNISENISPLHAKDFVWVLTSFFKESPPLVSNQIVKIIKIRSKNDTQLIKATTDELLRELMIAEGDAHKWRVKTIIELIKIDSNHDFQSVQEDLKDFFGSLKISYGRYFDRVSKMIVALIKWRGNSNILLIREALNMLTESMQNDEWDRESIEKALKGFIKLGGKEEAQLIKETFESLIQPFDTSNGPLMNENLRIIKGFLSLNDQSDLQFARAAFQTSIQLLRKYIDSPPTSYTRGEIFDLLKNIKNYELVQDALKILIPLLQDPKESVRNPASQTIVGLISSSGVRQSQLAKDLLNNLTPLLQGSQKEIQISATRTIIDLIKVGACHGPQLAQTIFEVLNPLLKDPDVEKKVVYQMMDLMEKRSKSDVQLTRSIFEALKDWKGADKKTIFQRFIKVIWKKGNEDNQLARNIFDVLRPMLKEPDTQIQAIDHLIDLMGRCIEIDIQLTQDIFSSLDPILLDQQGNVRDQASTAILLGIQAKGESQLVRDLVTTLTPLLNQKDQDVRKVAYDLINQLMKEKGRTGPQVIQDALDNLKPLFNDSREIIKEIASKVIVQLLKISNKKNDELAKVLLSILVPLLKNPKREERDSALSTIADLSHLTDLDGNQIFTDVWSAFIPFIKDSTLDNILNFVHFRTKSHDQLVQHLYQTLPSPSDMKSDLTQENSFVLTLIIQVMKFSPQKDNQFAQEIFDILISALQNDDNWYKDRIADNIIMLIELTRNTQFVKETVEASIPLLNHLDADTIERMVFKILLQNPADLARYLNHPSKELRDSLISSLIRLLKPYVESFEYLEKFFKDSKCFLTWRVFHEEFSFSWKILRETQREVELILETFQNNEVDFKKYESELKPMLVLGLNHIETFNGPQIIELAMAAIGKEKVSAEDSNHHKLIELARDVLNIQINYLNNDGLQWVHDNHEKLISLSPETTKSFDRKVFLKLLEHEKITPLEESLLIKFIKQGLTTSLKIYKKDDEEEEHGEIIFEGKHHKLRGDNVRQTLETIAKTILNQQQKDLLALQYKQHEPLFAKSKVEGGMNKAAVDRKDIKSIVDTRQILKIDFWMLTILQSKSEIIILEKRSAFGDHFIYHSTGQKEFKFYSNEKPPSKEIFGSYRRGEYYSGEVKELTDKIGQQLFATQGTAQISQIKGTMLSKQIYFQQELLGEGSGDRNEGIQKALATKLDNNRLLLADILKPLNLIDLQKFRIEAYCEGFVSTISRRYTSSQVIAEGKVVIDDGTDYFNLANLFFQLSQLDTFGVGYVIAEGLNAIRSHLKTIPIINEANFTKDIAVDAVELSDLAWKTVLRIISIKENRKRILDVKEEQQKDTYWKKIKSWLKNPCVCTKLKKKMAKYETTRNMFEKDILRSPAYKLGENDAENILKAWVELKHSDPSHQMKHGEKVENFAKTAINDGNK